MVDTVIIGAGHAGLALSRLLTDAGHEHVVLERGRVGERWRSERWHSLALLTPNWANQLPGDEPPADPDAYQSRSEFIARLQRYAWSFAAPLQERTTVLAVEQARAGLIVQTDRGHLYTRNVVLATGDCTVPAAPWFAATAPLEQLHAAQYRSPKLLTRGGVLVVGGGPSGHQIADELARAGRRVVLAVGRHARILRRYRGRDMWAWLDALGDLSKPFDPRRRPAAALPLDGRGGGRTMDLRTLAAAGVELTGRLEGFTGTHALFAPGLAADIADADRRLARLLGRVDDHIGTPSRERIVPVQAPSPVRVMDLDGFSTIVWATGYRRQFPFLRVPEAVGPDGGIVHDRGVTPVPGLYVLGMRWQSRMISHQIGGVAPDAAALVEHIAGRALPLAA
jgi:putative flavoprotein involved in K+ transport